jgi:deoxyribonuclease-4
MRLGLHIATQGNLVATPARARALGAETIQVFASNPRGWKPTAYTDTQGGDFKAACKAANIDPVWAHMIYLVSYGTEKDELREKSVIALGQTLEAADILGISGVVTHLGSHKGLGFDQALERLKQSFISVLEQDHNSLILMENSAGAGGNIGNSLEELAAILDALKGHKQMGICIDTAHALTSGYEIRTQEGLDAFLTKFDRLIGLDRLVLMHLNDSKADIDTHVDRHENIGDGFLDTETFRHIINHPLLQNISGVLEVPGVDGKSGPDKPNMDRLLSLRTT